MAELEWANAALERELEALRDACRTPGPSELRLAKELAGRLTSVDPHWPMVRVLLRAANNAALERCILLKTVRQRVMEAVRGCDRERAVEQVFERKEWIG